MTMPHMLEKLVHHHEKPSPKEPQTAEPQRDSVETEGSAGAKPEPTTPPAEPHQHGLLHKLTHPLEKKPHAEGESKANKDHPHHHHLHHPHLHHPNYHQDPVYAHHASDSAPSPTAQDTHKPEPVSTGTPPKTPPHEPSSPIHKGWEKIKKVAHHHHENANESFDAYYGALTEGATPTAPDRRASCEAGPSDSAAKPKEEHETKEEAIARLGAIEREKHHREHTMGYGVAAV